MSDRGTSEFAAGQSPRSTDMAHRIEPVTPPPQEPQRLGLIDKARVGIGRVFKGAVSASERMSGVQKPTEDQARDPGFVAHRIATEMRGIPVTGKPIPFTDNKLLKSAFYFSDRDLVDPRFQPVIAGIERSVQALLDSGQISRETFSSGAEPRSGYVVTDMKALEDRATAWQQRQKALRQ